MRERDGAKAIKGDKYNKQALAKEVSPRMAPPHHLQLLTMPRSHRLYHYGTHAHNIAIIDDPCYQQQQTLVEEAIELQETRQINEIELSIKQWQKPLVRK